MAEKKGWKEIPIGGVILDGGNSTRNKTGSWRAFRPVVDSEKCINCMQCVINCPDMAIKVKEGKRTKTDLDFCKGCGICAEICPVKCIKMEEEAKFTD